MVICTRTWAQTCYPGNDEMKYNKFLRKPLIILTIILHLRSLQLPTTSNTIDEMLLEEQNVFERICKQYLTVTPKINNAEHNVSKFWPHKRHFPYIPTSPDAQIKQTLQCIPDARVTNKYEEKHRKWTQRNIENTLAATVNIKLYHPKMITKT